MGDDVAQGRRANADFAASLKDRIQIRIIQSEMGDAQIRAVVASGTHRIRLGKQVPMGAVGVNQVDDPELLGGHRGARGTAGGSAAARFARLHGVFAIYALGKIKAKEKVTPRWVDRIRVVEELPIQCLNGTRFGVAQMGMEVH